MSPRSPIQYTANRVACHSESICDVPDRIRASITFDIYSWLALDIVLSYPAHLLFSEDIGVVGYSLRAWALSAASLLRHILHIVRLGTQKKMVGVDAPSVVAFMQNPKAIWYRSPKDNPGCPVGANVLSRRSRDGDNSIILGISCTIPIPASRDFVFVKFSVDPSSQSFHNTFIHHLLREVY